MYNIGDKVQVKSLKSGQVENHVVVTQRMAEMSGEIVTITYRDDYYVYHIQEDNGIYNWEENMFKIKGEDEDEI